MQVPAIPHPWQHLVLSLYQILAIVIRVYSLHVTLLRDSSNLQMAVVKCGKGTSRPFESFTQSILSLHNHVRQFLITLCLHGWVQFLKEVRLIHPPWHSYPPDQDLPFVQEKGKALLDSGRPRRVEKRGKALPLREFFNQTQVLPSSLYYSSLSGIHHVTAPHEWLPSPSCSPPLLPAHGSILMAGAQYPNKLPTSTFFMKSMTWRTLGEKQPRKHIHLVYLKI